MPQFNRETFTKVRFRGGSGSYILMPVLTSTQRDALTNVKGLVIYNSTTGQLEETDGTTWRAVGKGYGDTTFLPLAGGALTGDVTVASGKTIDGVDISVHAADLDAHTYNLLERYRTGVQYYSPLLTCAPGSTLAIVANTLWAVAFPIARPCTVNQIFVSVITGVAGSIRLGIYDDGTNLYPGSLILDCGTVDCTTSGVKTITISQALTRGIKWVAFVSDVAPSLYYQSTYMLNLLGYDTTAPSISLSVGFTYAVLPATFTGGGGVQYGKGWNIGLQFASMD